MHTGNQRDQEAAVRERLRAMFPDMDATVDRVARRLAAFRAATLAERQASTARQSDG